MYDAALIPLGWFDDELVELEVTGAISQKTGALLVGTVLAGADVRTAAETGALVTAALQAGADVSERAEMGALIAGSLLAGGDATTRAETGALLAAALVAGADAATVAETGSLTAGALLAGVDAATNSETGSLVVGHVNLIPNGGIETNTTNWAGVSGTVSRQSTEAQFGSWSLRAITNNATPNEGARTNSVDVQAGNQYTASVYVHGPSGTVVIGLNERDAADAPIGDTFSSPVTLNGGWQRIGVTRTMGAIGVKARIKVQTDVQQALTFYVDGAQLEVGATATPYIETDGAAAGTGVVLSGASASPVSQKTGALLAAVLLAGADVAEHSETGALTPAVLAAGADVYTAAETGAVIASALLSGADSATRAEAGSLIAQAILNGTDVLVDTQTGSIVAGGLVSGSSFKEAGTKTGALLSTGQVAAADVAEHAETAALVAGALAQGADVYTAAETGALIASALLAGADVYVGVRSGALTTNVVLSGFGDAAEPLLYLEAGFTATSTLAGAGTSSGFDGAFTATNTLEGAVAGSNLEAGFVTVGGLEA